MTEQNRDSNATSNIKPTLRASLPSSTNKTNEVYTDYPIEQDIVKTTSNGDDLSKTLSLRSLVDLIHANKEYADKLEAKLERLQEVIENDVTVTKTTTVQGISISIKFGNGIPVIPLNEAFALNLAVSKLIEAHMSDRTGKARPVLSPFDLNGPIDLSTYREVVQETNTIEDFLNS